jgi:DNA-binding NarL/FixJ family response regulator
MSLRFLVADDHAVVRCGLHALLEAERGWKICAEASDGREAVSKSIRLRPDFAILDVSMPRLNGLEATRQIVKSVPETKVLILTMHDTPMMIRSILASGARACILKSDAPRSLILAIRALDRGRPFFSSSVSEAILKEYHAQETVVGDESPSGAGRLTAREMEILRLVVSAKSTKEVAVLLAISTKTVEAHRANIMRKLDVHSTPELLNRALRERLVEVACTPISYHS